MSDARSYLSAVTMSNKGYSIGSGDQVGVVVDDVHSDQHKIDEPQLNVGGHGRTQRRLRNYHLTMIGMCSGIGTGLFGMLLSPPLVPY